MSFNDEINKFVKEVKRYPTYTPSYKIPLDSKIDYSDRFNDNLLTDSKIIDIFIDYSRLYHGYEEDVPCLNGPYYFLRIELKDDEIFTEKLAYQKIRDYYLEIPTEDELPDSEYYDVCGDLVYRKLPKIRYEVLGKYKYYNGLTFLKKDYDETRFVIKFTD